MILHCLVGMGDSHFAESFVTGSACRPGEKLQVHHIVDNYGILPYLLIEILRTDQSYLRIITGSQRIRTGN